MAATVSTKLNQTGVVTAQPGAGVEAAARARSNKLTLGDARSYTAALSPELRDTPITGYCKFTRSQLRRAEMEPGC